MKIKFLTVLSLAAVMFMAACFGKSDADVAKAATDKLKTDNVAGATVTVKDGVATLTGEVADAAAKAKAEASAKVEGVKSVVNNLTIKPLPTPVPASPDPILKTAIEDGWKKAGCTGASVEVSAGVATGRGMVPKGKLGECVQVANQAKPKQFVNQLTEAK
ncbi:MAG: BON domain-containing protein [Pyrinomonadaceae bacterium]